MPGCSRLLLKDTCAEELVHASIPYSAHPCWLADSCTYMPSPSFHKQLLNGVKTCAAYADQDKKICSSWFIHNDVTPTASWADTTFVSTLPNPSRRSPHFFLIPAGCLAVNGEDLWFRVQGSGFRFLCV